MSSMVHVKYEGRSEDIGFEDLFQPSDYQTIGILADTKPTPQNVTPAQYHMALAIYFDRPLSEFQEMHIDVSPNGNVTVRPQAVFG